MIRSGIALASALYFEMTYDFERLKILCGRASCLPPLAASVARLIEATDESEPSETKVAAVISSDPMLCSRILRAANANYEFGDMPKIQSVDGAILRIGFDSIHSMAVSLSLQSSFMNQMTSSLFDPLSYARHSIVVGLLGRRLFNYWLDGHDRDTLLTPNEVFAAGILHDLPAALLAWVAPTAYEQVHIHCRSSFMSIEQAFREVFGGSLRELGGYAIHTWDLPEVFELTARWADEPQKAPNERGAVTAINYASAVADSNIAQSNGFASAPWSSRTNIDRDVQTEIGIREDELNSLFETALNQAEFFLPSKLMTGSVYLKGRKLA
jgi:HD-like signal output (HDOD) protein